jgi:hypothetical protein
MSQHGANMLVKSGWRFDQILQQYYQDNDGKLRLDYVKHFRAMAVADFRGCILCRFWKAQQNYCRW